MGVIGLTLFLALQAGAPKGDGGLDPQKVDQAIAKGITYLRECAEKAPLVQHGPVKIRTDELVLWTFLHAGVPASDELFQRLLERMLESEPSSTYRASLRAMVLEDLDRVKYQDRIWECAQFLVDNQCKNGQWSYGEKTVYPAFPVKDVASGKGEEPGKRPEGKKAPVKRKVPVRPQRQGPDTGDLSNSQYAALGLRACHEAGILLPHESLERAAKSWREAQNGSRSGKKGKGVASGGPPAAEPRGWGYNRKYDDDQNSTGSMTAGAVGALAIYDRLLVVDPARDEDLQAGVSWLTQNFSVQGNPKTREWHFYYLYALERAGIYLGTTRFGTHDWYSEGARVLLDGQAADGGWWSRGWEAGQDLYEPGHVWETCFAVLFLRRAARPLKDVASLDRYVPPREK